MSTQSRYSMESRPSLRSEDGVVGRVSDYDMKRRCNGISSTDLAMSTYRDRGLSTRLKIDRRLLTTHNRMDSLSSLAGEQLRLSRSNTITVRRVISSLSISTSHLWKRFLTSRFGLSPWWRLLNGTTGTRRIQRTLDSGTTLRNVQQMKLECTSVDRTGDSNG